MNTDGGAAFTAIMVAASTYGREYVWAGVVAAMLIFGSKKTKLDAIELVILFTAGILTGELLKYLINKPRPFEILLNIVTHVPREYDSSFPSGHALIVAIGATFALLKFQKKSIALALTLEASIVAYSRVYVGMHYPLDVMAGVCIGAAIAFLGVSLLDHPVQGLSGWITQFTRAARQKINSRLP
jgi:membrane-associated phospholipid phosphatase